MAGGDGNAAGQFGRLWSLVTTTLCPHPDYCFYIGCPFGRECEHSSRGSVEGHAANVAQLDRASPRVKVGSSNLPDGAGDGQAGIKPGPRETLFRNWRGVFAALIPSGECGRSVTLVSRRADTLYPKRFWNDLEAAYGVAGEKPRHVCNAQALIARRAGKPMRATPHGSFGLSIRRRADAQEGYMP